MAEYLLRVAAQNFAATVFDSNDLSTIRGGCLALLDRVASLTRDVLAGLAGAGATVDIVSSGASELLARIRADAGAGADFDPDTFVAAVRSTLRAAGPKDVPADLFSLAVACLKVERGDLPKVVAAVEMKLRTSQYRTLSFPLPPRVPTARRPCALNGRLPATPGKEVKGQPVSESVATRHAFGRERRSGFYAQVLAGTPTAERLNRSGWGFTESLADLTADYRLDLPVSLSGKIALLMLDGNGFQAARNKLLAGRDGAAAVAAFSDFVLQKQRAVLTEIVEFALRRPHMATLPTKDDGPRLRLETLLWGGDEVLFAVPVWAAWGIALLVMDALATWKLEGPAFADLPAAQRTLTHGVGLLFANHKTPIRQSRALVDELVYASKAVSKTDSLLSVFALESVDLPVGGVSRIRTSLFGAAGAGGTADLTVSGGGSFLAATERLEALKGVLPRSQAMKRALAARDGPGGLDAANAKDGAGSWAEETRQELRRVLRAADAERAIDLLGLGRTGASPFRARQPDAKPTEGWLKAVPLLQALHLWDYVRPLGPGCDDPNDGD